MSRRELVRFLNRTVAFKAKKVAGGGTTRKEWEVVAVTTTRFFEDATFSTGAGGWYRSRLTNHVKGKVMRLETVMVIARAMKDRPEVLVLNESEAGELEIVGEWDYFPLVNAKLRCVAS
jgi:hypothetical protein